MTKESQDTVDKKATEGEGLEEKLDGGEQDPNLESTERTDSESPLDGDNASKEADSSGETDSSSAKAADTAAAETESLRQQILRVHADFDNFRKRTRQEKEDLQRFATKKLLLDLLPVVDNFDRALTSLEEASSVDEVKTGLDMVHRQLLQVLQQNGVVVMDALDKPFDPNVHDAVMQEQAEGKDAGIVSQVLQKGYMLHDKVLRPAMVKVTV